MTDDSLYERARKLLRSHPGLGKKRLADMLGVKTPTSRKLMHRYRGETEGHASEPVYQRFLKLKETNLDWGAGRMAHELQITKDHAELHLARWRGAQAYQQPNPPAPAKPVPGFPPVEAGQATTSLQDAEDKNGRDICYRGPEIRTLDGLLAHMGVDLGIYEVESHTINRWEMAAKMSSGEIVSSPLYQVRAKLRRRVVERRLEELMGGLLEQLRNAAPARPALARPAGGNGLLEVSIMDTHLGKLAWEPETGRAYDIEIAEKMYWAALEDLLARASHLKPQKILFVAGNDLLHTDILGRTTTSGTPQDSDVVWKQAFVHARKLMVQAIERLREVAPVHVSVVNGNHDTMSVFHLGEVLAAHFGRSADVKVDNSPTQRKYVHFGENLIGLTHGNMEREKFLPLLMAQEQKTAWAVTRHREWHLGHWHVKRHRIYVPRAGGALGAEDQQGVLIRIIPSLAAPDSWHASMGYGGKLAAEAYYWHEHDGCVATFTHSPP